MGLFNNEDKKQKQLEDFKRTFNLDGLSESDLEVVKRIANRLASGGLLELGTLFSGSAVEKAQTDYLMALVEQNWLIIKKLDEISNKLK